jgi:hypothetical protein
VRFDWRGEAFRIDAPERLGDAHFIWIDGLDAGPGELQLALVRKRRWWEAFLKRPAEELWESEALARPVEGADVAREPGRAKRAEGARGRSANPERPEPGEPGGPA